MSENGPENVEVPDPAATENAAAAAEPSPASAEAEPVDVNASSGAEEPPAAAAPAAAAPAAAAPAAAPAPAAASSASTTADPETPRTRTTNVPKPPSSSQTPKRSTRTGTARSSAGGTTATASGIELLPKDIDNDPEYILNLPEKKLSNAKTSPRAVISSRRPEAEAKGKWPGPGEYHPEVPWHHGAPRFRPPTVESGDKAERERSPGPAQYYPAMSWQRTTATIKSRHTTTYERQAPPGPAYTLPSMFNPPKQVGRSCTFGRSFGALEYHSRDKVPGPGAYAPMPPPKAGGGRGAIISSRSRGFSVKAAPGPGSYDLPSSFASPRSGRGFTIKGRLPHPVFDSTDASHEAAKVTATARVTVPRRQKHTPRG